MAALPDHGTNARYGRGCKCVLCKRAKADYQSRWRNAQSRAAVQVSPIVHCPTCHAPAYQRSNGYQYAPTQPGHPSAASAPACVEGVS